MLLTDPERLRVVHSRARVWAEVLEDVLGAHSETLPSGSIAPDDHAEFDRGIRLTPRQPGALPLLLLERGVPTLSGDVTSAVLDVGAGDLGILVASLPDCGCDACDSGSSDLLDAVDSTLRHHQSSRRPVLAELTAARSTPCASAHTAAWGSHTPRGGASTHPVGGPCLRPLAMPRG